jgi:alpha-galactosidase
MPTTTHTGMVALRAAGTAVLLAVDGPDLPRVLHWGADVGPDVDGVAAAVVPGVPHGTLDEVWPLTVLPGAADGWPGRPALRGHRGGRDAFPRWVVERVEVGPGAVTATAADAELGLALELRLALDPAGVLVVTTALTNTGAEPYVLDALTPLLPVPGHAREVLDLAGRWCRENAPQRSPLHVGVRSRETWRGRPGHDATPLLVVGTPGFGFRHGEVWGVHVAWSGDAEHLVERVPEGHSVLGGGEIVRPLVLAPGEHYAAPDVVATWSDAGLDGLSARLHAHVRARPAHPRSPRPVVCNTW